MKQKITTYSETSIQAPMDFSCDIMKGRRKWSNIFQALKNNKNRKL